MRMSRRQAKADTVHLEHSACHCPIHCLIFAFAAGDFLIVVFTSRSHWLRPLREHVSSMQSHSGALTPTTLSLDHFDCRRTSHPQATADTRHLEHSESHSPTAVRYTTSWLPFWPEMPVQAWFSYCIANEGSLIVLRSRVLPSLLYSPVSYCET